MVEAANLRRRATQIAGDVLAPAAPAVDAADSVPTTHLDLLAAEGFYALFAPPEYGGVTDAGISDVADIVSILASGCLATTFVWLQHHTPIRAVAGSASLRDEWLAPMARGARRAGIALAGLRAGAAGLRVGRGRDGFVLDGDVPWVTGWGHTDVIEVGAVDDAGIAHFLLIDHVADTPSLVARPLDLVAVRASRTVTLTFENHVVPASRLIGIRPLDEWRRDEESGSQLNGFLAVGLGERCRAIFGPGPLDEEWRRCRSALLTADAASTPAARAAASELALRSAAALMVHAGSRSVLRDHHAQRLLREAAFLLVFGTRPAIRDELLTRLGGRVG